MGGPEVREVRANSSVSPMVSLTMMSSQWREAVRGGGATSGIRTHDLTFTKRPLCQLSYGGNGRHYTSRRDA